ncbi:uncharacterized protein N7515_004680 [Penicillium bovifimosum]|uniref:Cytochrome b5 heme-binding domain-containing protein n=1 Tax=Penicillium bovifimosum TaxID=126998 RepID=A0A9W9H0K6_9EURO|nr:uncharacterized protein N7515_004680 [Penicillium bovifimosum]KAJ5135402.1 hypothetical protein N7515_004680 [Penicillium bovifimosum]
MSQLESITLEQLATHNTPESLWIAVHGHVYDLTTFSSDHPGGIEALESCAGADGTESYEYAGHSESNMAKLQQYRVGRVAGSLPQISSIYYPPHVENKRITSATSRLKQLKFPRTKWAVTVSATAVVVALSCQRRDLVDYISPLNISQLQFRTMSDQINGHAFWTGMAVASSVSYVGFRYLYKLFLSTLDYQNEVFSFPATIPRKTKR